MIDELIQQVRDRYPNLKCEALDGLVHDAKDAEAVRTSQDVAEENMDAHYDGYSHDASEINNQGVDAQLRFLLSVTPMTELFESLEAL